MRAIVGERFAPRLARYPGRTLIINGDRDLFFRLSARRFSRVARDRHRIRLHGATHLANLDRPRAFNHAIRRFMDGLPEPDAVPGDRSADGRDRDPVLDLADPPRPS